MTEEQRWTVVKSKKGSTSTSASKDEEYRFKSELNSGQRSARENVAGQEKKHSANSCFSNRRDTKSTPVDYGGVSKTKSVGNDSNAKHSAPRTPGTSRAFVSKNAFKAAKSESQNDASTTTSQLAKPVAKIPEKVLESNQRQQLQGPTSMGQGSETKDAGTAPTKRKKKKVGAIERRKKREDKYFQALYKNKDSHIQFVSADFIRQFQSHNPGASSSKPGVNKQVDSSLPSLEDHPVSTAEAWQARGQGQALHKLDFHFPSLSQDRTVPKDRATVGEELKLPHVNECDSKHVVEIKKTEAPSAKTVAPVAQTLPSSGKKKSQRPMILDIGTLAFSVKKEDVDEKKTTAPFASSTKSGFSKENYKVTAGNPLDSSGPGVIHRGKIRQKKKKPSKLKLTILKSRALRKMFTEEANKQIDEALTTEDSVLEEEQTEVVPLMSEECHELLDGKVNETGDIEKSNASIQETGPFADINAESIVHTSLPISNEKGATTDPIKSCDNSQNPTGCGGDADKKFLQLLDEIMLVKNSEQSVASETEVAVKGMMHSRKFRDYCDMYTTKELHGLVMQLVSELYRFQDRLYHTDPIKFKTKRRLVSGVKEAISYLNLNKVQLLIIAPDIEKNAEPGGLDDRVRKILTLAKEKKVPYIFSGSKYILGKQIRIKTPVSIIAILDKQNCEEIFRKLLDESEKLREKYKADFLEKTEQLNQH